MQEETRKASWPGHSLGESKRLSLKEISTLCREGSEAGRMMSRDMNRVCGRCLVDDNWLWGLPRPTLFLQGNYLLLFERCIFHAQGLRTTGDELVNEVWALCTLPCAEYLT